MPRYNRGAMDETINTMSEKNCPNCIKATERRTTTGHTGWHCTVNDIDVNSRMSCEEHEGEHHHDAAAGVRHQHIEFINTKG